MISLFVIKANSDHSFCSDDDFRDVPSNDLLSVKSHNMQHDKRLILKPTDIVHFVMYSIYSKHCFDMLISTCEDP